MTTTIERARMVQNMHEIITCMNNEEAYCRWIYVVPDGADVDDFEFIAEDEELLEETCNLFRELIETYGSDGFCVCHDTKAFGVEKFER